MKTIYSSAFICCFLVGFSSRGQVNETTLPGADRPAPLAQYVPEGAILEVNSNAVDAVTIFWLPDQAEEISPAAPVGLQGTVAGSGAPVALAVPIEEASSNGQSVVRFVYQNSPGILTATSGLALGAAQSGNSPQPLSSISGCVRAGSGVVGWWQAEGNANDTAGSHTGQTPNGVTYVSGEVGQAFSLNGSSQSVQIPYAANLVTTGLTVEVWVNPAHTISSQAYVFGQAYGRQLIIRPGTTGVGVGFLVTSTNGTFYGVYSSRDIPTGQWTHLAGTWNGTNLMLYLNGVLDRSSTLSLPTIGDSGCPFSIGGMISSCGYSGQYFPGQLDEVSLYDRALLAGEINAIYQAGAAGKCKTPPGCSTSPLSAVASWPGEGDASDMFNINPGTLQNGVAFDHGMVARAFSFNGSQQAVEIPSSSTLLTTPFSVEAWIKPASRGSGSVGQAFIYGQSYGRQLVVRNGFQGLRVAFTIATSRTTFYDVDSSGDIPIGEWTHLVGTYDGSVLSLYINGALDQRATVNITPWDSGCPFHIGGIYDPSGGYAYSGQYFNGLIDEVTCYDQALAAGDVSALYNAGEAGKCNSLGYWLGYYFGPDCWNESYATAPADADGDQVTNFEDYLSGIDPNRIEYMASFPNDHVNAASINASVLVQGGIPYQIAVLVNSTNFAAAGWNPYNATVPVSLGPTDGWYDVWIGLKGYALTSVQTWHGFRVMRDTAAPAVYITSPVGNTLSRPELQLEGYSPEPLGSISYDLANVAGTVTGLEGYVTGQSFDTNSLSFTTNWFECLDIPLTNGANTITLHLTDLAGNVTTSVYTYTLDYSGVTSGPALTLYWPQNGGVVSGTSFTLRGLLDDPTATVAAQITDGNGVTSQGDGLVERNGLLWVENLPLGPGANTLTLSMTNAAGKSSSTSLTVIQSDVVLTIADLSNTDLNQPFIYVSGTIIGDGYTVWVNGVQATLYGGTWGAVNVPVNVGGTAAIQARAIPNTDHGGQGTGGSGGTVSTMANPGNPTSPGARDAESVPDKRPEVVEIHYDKKLWDKFAELAPNTYREVVNESIKWDLGQGGVRFWDHCWGEPIQEYFNFEDRIWDASGVGVWHSGSTVGPGACGARVENASGPCQVTAWSGEFCQVSDEYDDAGGKTSRVRSAHTKYQLRTNGKGKSHRQNLFALGAIAWGVGDYFWPEVDWDPWSYSIPVTSIAIGQFGPMESSGCLYRVLPDNRTFDVTPTVLGNPYYTFSVPDVTKYLSHFTVYVDMPGPPPSHIDHVGFDYGHAWWMLDCDASAEIVNKFTTPNRTHFLGEQVGYGRAPAWSLLNPVGELRDPEYNTNISVAKTFTIGFDGLLGGLVFTRTLHDNPGYYNVFENNCMHKVSAAGAAAGVAPALPADTKPETFGWDIYNLP